MTVANRKLRVLHVITHLALGGATKNVLAICSQCDKSRFEPAILSGSTHPDEAALEMAADGLGVKRHTLPSLRRPIQPFADFVAYRDLVAWLKTHAPDIVHTHGSKAGILGRLAASAAGIPVIIHTVHGWGHHSRQHHLLRRGYVAFERSSARVTDRILVVADASRQQGLADGIGTEQQYVTVRGGVDIAAHRDISICRPDLCASLGIPANAAVVGTVSRMAAQKAPEDFVRMAKIIHDRLPDTHFVFVGGGPLLGTVQKQAEAAGLSPVMHLLGYRDDVPSLLRAFDVFVLNSLWEGLPAVFPQAMCAALPIVATDVDGAQEVITEGQNGFLVPPGQPRLQAEKVLELLHDPALRTAMGQRGLDLVYPQFCEREMVRRIEEIYWECAQAKHLVAGPYPVSCLSEQPSALQEPITL